MPCGAFWDAVWSLPLTMHSSDSSCAGYRKFLNRNEWQTKSLLNLQQGTFLIMWMFHVCLRKMAMWFTVGELLLIHLVRKLKFGNLFFIFQQQTFTSIIQKVFFKSEENKRSLNDFSSPYIMCFDCTETSFSGWNKNPCENIFNQCQLLIIVIYIAEMLKDVIISETGLST